MNHKLNLLRITGFVLILMSACTIRFTRPPANSLDAFPESLRGTYVFSDPNHHEKSFVTITQNTILFSDNKILRGGGISDSLKICKGEKYYYLCQSDSLKDRLVWDIYPAHLKGKKLYLYALDAETYERKIRKYFIPVKGYDILYEMDEDRLNRFCKKALKPRKAMILKKQAETKAP